MIRKTLHQWLSAVYGLPVLEDFEQTNVEQAISYDLTTNPVRVRIESDSSVKFEIGFDVLYRCPNGYAGIGFLSLMLSDTNRRPPGFSLTSAEGLESIEYQTKTEMIISKPLSGFIKLEHNKVRELIKCVVIPDSLNCVEQCVTGAEL